MDAAPNLKDDVFIAAVNSQTKKQKDFLQVQKIWMIYLVAMV